MVGFGFHSLGYRFMQLLSACGERERVDAIIDLVRLDGSAAMELVLDEFRYLIVRVKGLSSADLIATGLYN